MSPTSCPVGCDSWEFAAEYFGDCVCSRRDALSFTLGCVSIVAWGVAELPQIVANWRNKSSEGVSLAFIATWLTGDAFNLVGCAVSPTLPTQLYTAMLYTATTVVLVAQHLHYTKLRETSSGRLIERPRTSKAVTHTTTTISTATTTMRREAAWTRGRCWAVTAETHPTTPNQIPSSKASDLTSAPRRARHVPSRRSDRRP